MNGAAPVTGGVPELSQKAEYAVIGYITAYLYNDFSAVCYFDAAMSTVIEEQFGLASEDWSMKADNAKKQQVKVIRRNEREKRTNSTYAPFENPDGSTATLSPLYKVLYPGMKYRIIEVRETKRKISDALAGQCTRDVTVELSYPDVGYAPHHKGRRIKRGLVRVFLQKWPLEYKVCGYLPVRDGVKYYMRS